ncbi:ZrgA family zinc uptake protein [Ruegeria arenilitoris]|uniref:ZrgA family zinc uptake protein n=1 Tax=Ruegeria arenilitoris TaxID=1173585 RepID=UPI003C7ED056
MKSAAFALILISAVFVSQAHTAVAQDHAAGDLDIVVSGAEFTLSLAVPAAGILGTEKPAQNDEGRDSIAVAISDLSKPLELFVVPEEAECFAAMANVTLSAIGLGQDTDTTRTDGDDTNEFQAEYLIRCKNIDVIEAIHFAYFERFPTAEKLAVRVDQAGKSRAQNVTRGAPDLMFK